MHHNRYTPSTIRQLAMGLAVAGLPMAGAANPLIISEYIEGSGNNKAIEIANTGNEAVPLEAWELQVFFNGNDSPGLTVNLSGSIAPDGTHVFASSNAADAVLAQTDQLSGAGLFNGNDAVVLLNGGAAVDRVGRVGEDPGSAWSGDGIGTQNDTLRRRPDALGGDSNTRAPFDPASVFTSHGLDNVEDLGQFGSDSGDGGGDSPAFGACGDDATRIAAIQGEGARSPLKGEPVRIEAVVSAVMPDLDGFFLEAPAPQRDNNPMTSEALFVYAPDQTVDEGRRIRIAGSVAEYNGQTQLGNITDLVGCGGGTLPEPASLSLPAEDSEREALESQRVRIDQTLTVSATYNLGRYGQALLSSGGRLFNPTQVAAPGNEAAAVAERNQQRRILLDDASSNQNPETIPYPQPELTAANTLRLGDTTESVTGVLDLRFEDWRIQPLKAPTFTSDNPRKPAPSPEGDLRVASLNMLNFFNGDGMGGGFPTARGADTADELERQKDKLIAAIEAMDADILALMELENDGYGENSAIAELADSLSGHWRVVDPGLERLGSDAITVSLIYRADRVETLGEAATLSSGAFSELNRQPLAQTFNSTSGDGGLTVIVNHFKSKGCRGAEGPNTEQGDGQGCWNPVRTAAAKAIANWASNDPTASGEDNVLVTGDLNAYAKEDPLRILTSAGFQNLMARDEGEPRYSYVFDGESGTLDYALANSSLSEQVVEAHIWHANADEPRALDYNLEYQTPEQQASLFSATPWRGSDHDPLLVDLTFNSTPEGDLNGDGRVTARDLAVLITALFHGNGNPELDLNNDDRVSLANVWHLTRLL